MQSRLGPRRVNGVASMYSDEDEDDDPFAAAFDTNLEGLATLDDFIAQGDFDYDYLPQPNTQAPNNLLASAGGSSDGAIAHPIGFDRTDAFRDTEGLALELTPITGDHTIGSSSGGASASTSGSSAEAGTGTGAGTGAGAGVSPIHPSAPEPLVSVERGDRASRVSITGLVHAPFVDFPALVGTPGAPFAVSHFRQHALPVLEDAGASMHSAFAQSVSSVVVFLPEIIYRTHTVSIHRIRLVVDERTGAVEQQRLASSHFHTDFTCVDVFAFGPTEGLVMGDGGQKRVIVLVTEKGEESDAVLGELVLHRVHVAMFSVTETTCYPSNRNVDEPFVPLHCSVHEKEKTVTCAFNMPTITICIGDESFAYSLDSI
jgi:hypothetical protein